jgi:hypothetical protein
MTGPAGSSALGPAHGRWASANVELRESLIESLPLGDGSVRPGGEVGAMGSTIRAAKHGRD